MVRPRFRIDKREAQIEEEACAEVLKRFQVFSLKIKRAQEVGWPDRLFLIPGGKPLFVEYKRPGEEPRTNQTIIHRRLKYAGYDIETHTSVEQTVQAVRNRLNDC